MKPISALLLAAAILAPATAHAQFIAKSLQGDGMIVGFTDVPCSQELGHKVLRARGNWMQAGCYSEVPGAAVLIHWKAADPRKAYDPSTFERVSTNAIEPTAEFRGWPKITPDLTQIPAMYQGRNK